MKDGTVFLTVFCCVLPRWFQLFKKSPQLHWRQARQQDMASFWEERYWVVTVGTEKEERIWSTFQGGKSKPLYSNLYKGIRISDLLLTSAIVTSLGAVAKKCSPFCRNVESCCIYTLYHSSYFGKPKGHGITACVPCCRRTDFFLRECN